MKSGRIEPLQGTKAIHIGSSYTTVLSISIIISIVEFLSCGRVSFPRFLIVRRQEAQEIGFPSQIIRIVKRFR